MHLVRRLPVLAVLTATFVAVGAAPASAHEKWFVQHPGSYPTDWSFAVRPWTLLALVLVCAVAVLWRRVAIEVTPTPELPVLSRLGRLAPYAPRLLAIHLGISLLAAAVGGHFLTHDLDLDGVTGGNALLLLEGALGVWFITGVRLRPAALALVVLGPFALLVTGPVDLLSAGDVLGVAAFLAVLPPSDGTFGAVQPDPAVLRRALLALRLGVGTALITLAFAEKLANPALARQTLRQYPALDVSRLVGLHLSPDAFITVAGATEVLFGLLVLSGALPQLAVLVAGIPFNATLILFGATEMLGHLPVYGVFLTLLVYGSNAQTAPLVRWLPRHGPAAQPVRRVPVLEPAS
jgi:hypothetical protein